jgi:thymidylate synthase
MEFKNAQEAFEFYYNEISNNGINFSNTKTLFDQGFKILNPLDNIINTKFRKWNHKYAEAEWQWYLSGDRNLKGLEKTYGKVPEIWKRMAFDNGDVNSNYGWQWNRNNQLSRVIKLLKANKSTRQATISIYDGKEIPEYIYDTPCTYSVQFTIVK